MLPQNSIKVSKYFSFFCKKIYFKELSKITQSGHTDCKHDRLWQKSQMTSKIAFLQYAKKIFSASQVLQLVDSFIHDDPNWLLFTTDISFGNLVVTRNENQVSDNHTIHIQNLIVNLELFRVHFRSTYKCSKRYLLRRQVLVP